MKFRKQHFVLAVTLAALFSGGLWLLSPWWIPLGVGLVASPYGLEWESVQARGWKSWSVTNLTVRLDGAEIALDHLEVPQPLPWLAGRVGLADKAAAAGGALVVAMKQTTPPPRQETTGIELLESIRSELLHQSPWIPLISLERLEMWKPHGSEIVALENLALEGTALSGRLSGTGSIPAMEWRLWLTGDSIRLGALPDPTGPDTRLSAILYPAKPMPDGHAQLVSHGVPLEFTAAWSQGNWLPSEISAAAKRWRVPIESGEDLFLDIHMQGDADFLEISTFNLRGEWVDARLSGPVRYEVATGNIPTSATFRIELDFSRQNRFPAEGKLTGDALLQPGSPWRPEIQFTLFGSDLGWEKAAVSQLQVIGNYSPRAGTFSTRGSFTLGPEMLTGQMPGLQIFESIKGTFTAGGTPEAVMHEGAILPLSIKAEGFHPLVIALDWKGDDFSALDLLARIESGAGGSIRADAELIFSQDHRYQLVLREALMEDPQGEKVLSLDKPFSLPINPTLPFPVECVPPFRLSGKNRYVAFSWNRDSGRIGIEAEGMDTMLLDGWVDRKMPPVRLASLSAEATQLQPCLEGVIALELHASTDQWQASGLRIRSRVDKDGIHIEDLEGSLRGQPVVSGRLELPMRLHPYPYATGRRFSFIPARPLQGQLTANIPDTLANELSGIPLLENQQGLHIELTTGGTPDKPEARLEARTRALPLLRLLDERLADYPLEDLNLVADINGDSIRIESLQAAVRSSRLNLSGSLPMGSLLEFLQQDKRNWHALLGEARLDASLDNLLSRDFASIHPAWMRPRGTAQGRLSIRPGPVFSGRLELADFGLRPTLYSQTVEDINLVLDIDGTRFTLADSGASVGNSAVQLNGYIDIAEPGAPVYEVHLTGERTPLVRTPDLLVHGDLDLVLDGSDPDQPATLGGSVSLRDSVLLLDIEPLAARTAGKGLPRPPFFSVRQQPFAQWRLNVDVSGDDFLRFRSAYVKALLSADLDLTGTLANPVWVGNLTSSEGNIDFPGLRTKLSRSEMFVTRENQDSLQLDVNSVGQVASYIISLRVNGSVDDPHVELTSTPELSNARILQLLATGSIDGSSLGSVGFYLGRGLFSAGIGGSVWDRLSVEIGRDVTESSKDTIDLYYDLTDRFRLHGEYDKYDAQNLNLEWEVFSR